MKSRARRCGQAREARGKGRRVREMLVSDREARTGQDMAGRMARNRYLSGERGRAEIIVSILCCYVRLTIGVVNRLHENLKAL